MDIDPEAFLTQSLARGEKPDIVVRLGTTSSAAALAYANGEIGRGYHPSVVIDLGASSGTTPTYSSYAISNAPSLSEGNSGATVFSFPVSRSGNNTYAETLAYAVTGTGANPASAADFQGGVFPAGTISFASGQTSGIVSVAVAGDATIEPDETFMVTISAPSAGGSISTASAIATILNDDTTSGGTALPQLSAVANRWSADDIPVQADNTALTTWTDGVGSAPATQATSAARPAYRTNRINGKPSVQFSGAQALTIGRPASLINALAATKSTIMLVFRNQGLGTSSTGCIFGNSATGTIRTDMFFCADARMGSYFNQGLPASTSGFTTMTFVRDNTQNPAVGRVAINGGFAHADNGGVWHTDTTDFILGSFTPAGDGTFPGYCWTGELLDVVIWGGACLSQPETLQAHMWAADKYAQPYPWTSLTYFTMFAGDSITAGVGGDFDTGNFPYKAAQSLGLAYGQWSNIGVPSITFQQMDASNAPDIDGIRAKIGKPVKVTVFEHANMRGAALSSMQSYVTTWLANRKAADSQIKIVLGNSTALGGTTQGDQSGAGGPTSAIGTTRLSYNTWINGLTTNVDGHIDYASNANFGVVGANPYSTTYPTTYFADATHPSATSYTGMAALAVTALQAIT